MWLAIDTATDRATVALRAGGEVLEAAVVGARQHARALPQLADQLLQQAGAAAGRLEGILLADGPGSFTGLRVGVAMAKALVLAAGVPLRVTPSLLGRAAAAGPGDVVAVSNALRGQLYAARYRFRGDLVETLSPAAVTTPERLLVQPVPDAVVGEAPDPVLGRLERWLGRPVVSGEAGAASAARLLQLLERPGATVAVDDPAAWEPSYGRPAEAQARWEEAHGRPLPDSLGSPR